MGPGTLAERLALGPVLLDGAMGTELMRRGLLAGEPPEGWLLTRPHVIFGVHHRYALAGAEVLYTCTFGANRLALGRHGLADRTVAINHKAVEVARMAARETGALVFGDLGPTGDLLEPYGDLPPARAREAFAEQATLLMAAGADGLVVESFADPAEALLAVAAARGAGARFILATLSFEGPSKHYRTMMGATPEEAAGALAAAGVTALGLNCGTNPSAMVEVARRMRAAVPGTMPIAAKPNAGLPGGPRTGDAAPEGPEAFAAIARDLAAAGATLIGGCCGTTPAHLAAVRAALAGAHA